MAQVKLHEYIAKQLAVCGRTQKEISEEIGYTKPNIITMFKQNKTKVPINKIRPLAIALRVDPVNMLRIAMLEYMPETWEALEATLGNVITENEMEMIEFIRRNSDSENDNPKIATEEQQKKLKDFSKSL
ncbi:MAG: hypothetical protein HRT93_07885 [Piscirickettsiaceae bacterium]|nr:hypothetical protein [Piscirickettsiaceae bacterium]